MTNEPNEREYLGEQLERVTWEPDIVPELLECNLIKAIWRTKRYRVAAYILRNHVALKVNAARAELTAPAEGDVEAADRKTAEKVAETINDDFRVYGKARFLRQNEVNVIAAALTTARKAEREKAASELHRYQKALDGLTIAGGGSNMHGDPEYQAKWVQERVNRHMDTAKRFAIERNNARARVEVLEAAARRFLLWAATPTGFKRKGNNSDKVDLLVIENVEEFKESRDALAALLAGEGKGEEERPTGIPDEIVSFFPDDSVPKEEVE